MNSRFPIKIVWLVIAVLAAIGSFMGGDTSIVCGWLFLFCTFPFWLAWQTYAYDHVLAVLPKNVTNIAGVTVSLVLAFVVWWYLVPYVMRMARSRDNKAHT